jgi:putative GTP pyrophosphokinase
MTSPADPTKVAGALYGQLEKEYQAEVGRFMRLCEELVKQVGQLLGDSSIDLASPIEWRVKTWDSIAEKIQRNALEPQALANIPDVAGVRIIALFHRDLKTIQKIIEDNFNVLRMEDAFTRLKEDQFGYGSIHYEIEPPPAWAKIPTLKKLHGLKAEVQVRTSSQHIWAAASHVLQYKKEAHVPLPIRRAINRVAALLETVDLEFERVLVEREQYGEAISRTSEDLTLNTESLKHVLDSTLPVKNRNANEDYANLVDDLVHFNVRTTKELEDLIRTHLKAAVKEDRQRVEKELKRLETGQEPIGGDAERIREGVFYTHVGLVRNILRFARSGEAVNEWLKKKKENT